MKPNPIRQLLCHLKCRKRSTMLWTRRTERGNVARASPSNEWRIDHVIAASTSSPPSRSLFLSRSRMNFLLFVVWTNSFYLWDFTACVVSCNMRPGVLILFRFFFSRQKQMYARRTRWHSSMFLCLLYRVKCDNRKHDSKAFPKWYDWTMWVGVGHVISWCSCRMRYHFSKFFLLFVISLRKHSSSL